MSSPDQARASQLRNIQEKTRASLEALRAAVAASGRTRHGEVRAWLMETYGLGYGDANALAREALASALPESGTADGRTISTRFTQAQRPTFGRFTTLFLRRSNRWAGSRSP